MIRYLKFAFIAVLTLVLVTVALANSAPVTLRVLPEQMAGYLGWSWSVELPLFIVIFGSILAGVFLGFVWEWLREHKHRAAARSERRRRDELEREVSQLRTKKSEPRDEVLAIVEHGSPAR